MSVEPRHQEVVDLRRHNAELEQSVQELSSTIVTLNTQLTQIRQLLPDIDTTEQHLVQERIRQQQTRLSLLFEQSPLAIVEWNNDFEMIGWNRAAERIFGYSRAEAIGQSYRLIVPTDAREQVGDVVSQALDDRTEVVNINQNRRKDGVLIMCEWHNFPLLDDTGSPIGVVALAQDISDRIWAEQQLRDSQAFLQSVVNGMPDPMFVKDEQHRWVLLNNAMCEFMGYSKSELIGKSDYDIFPKEQADVFWEHDDLVFSTGREDVNEEAFTDAHGTLRTISTKKTLFQDRLGNKLLIGMIRDITDRVQMEAALRDSESRYRQLAQREALINQLSQQIRQSLDVETILDTAVQEIQQILQVDRCQIVRHFIHDAASCYEVVKEAVRPGLPSGLGTFTFGLDAIPDDSMTTKVVRLPDVSGVQNPTLRGYFTKLNHVAIMATVIQNRSGRLTMIHCSKESVYHWTDDEAELLGVVGSQVAIALDQAELYQQSQTATVLAQEKATELEHTLHELQRTQLKLLQSEKMSSLGQLVAGVAHEINNPVNFIHANLPYVQSYASDLLAVLDLYQEQHPANDTVKAMLETLEVAFLKEDLQKIITSMQVGTERIKEIVLSLRTFSRLDQAEKKWVDLHENLESTLMLLGHRLKPSAERSEICLAKHYGELPRVECYAGELNQVLMNVLTNAIDALDESYGVCCEAPDGDHAIAPVPTITIRTELVDAPQTISLTEQREFTMPSAYIRICIADNGAGMPESVKQQLFDPFFTTKPVGKGTGLGMSISYQIITVRHHGNLWCESVLGQGTTFWIEIPYYPQRLSEPTLP